MAYIEIDIEKITANLQMVQGVCCKENLKLNVVTKFCLSDQKIIAPLQEAGLNAIADANMENFSRLPKGLSCELTKSVIKTRLTDIKKILELGSAARPDVVFVSDETLIKELCALPRDTRPKVVLIAEAGDLRDGFYLEDIPPVAARYDGIDFAGIAANFGCLSGKMPDVDSIKQLRACADAISKKEKAAVSIGGTVVWSLLKSGKISGLADELRMGEGIFFGYDTSSGIALNGFNRDAWTLLGEIVEIREKEIAPIPDAGHTAAGSAPPERNYGKRLCAVLDFGILGALMETLVCLDGSAKIAGQTYDFTVVDITDSSEKYKTGGFIPFRMMYAAAAHAILNPYIRF